MKTRPTITKKEIQQRVLQNGEPLEIDKFTWCETTGIFSTIEDGLVLNFLDLAVVAVNVKSNNTINVGRFCDVNAEDNNKIFGFAYSAIRVRDNNDIRVCSNNFICVRSNNKIQMLLEFGENEVNQGGEGNEFTNKD